MSLRHHATQVSKENYDATLNQMLLRSLNKSCPLPFRSPRLCQRHGKHQELTYTGASFAETMLQIIQRDSTNGSDQRGYLQLVQGV
jgi:hypothetical protein